MCAGNRGFLVKPGGTDLQKADVLSVLAKSQIICAKDELNRIEMSPCVNRLAVLVCWW